MYISPNFKRYLLETTHIEDAIKFTVEIRTPSEEKALQAVDFASWAIFRKWERGDARYYDYIKSKIIEENPLFP